MSYDNMPAGPELDRLVAEKVMGWEISWSGRILTNEELFGAEAVRTSWRPKGAKVSPKGPRWDVYTGRKSQSKGFNPSMKIAHAWEVVEKMTEQFGRAWPEMNHEGYGREICDYWFGDLLELSASNAALKICRAALKAVEAKQ